MTTEWLMTALLLANAIVYGVAYVRLDRWRRRLDQREHDVVRREREVDAWLERWNAQIKDELTRQAIRRGALQHLKRNTH